MGYLSRNLRRASAQLTLAILAVLFVVPSAASALSLGGVQPVGVAQLRCPIQSSWQALLPTMVTYIRWRVLMMLALCLAYTTPSSAPMALLGLGPSLRLYRSTCLTSMSWLVMGTFTP